MGGMSGLMGMMPGLGKMKKQLEEADLDNSVLKRQLAIISSMTPQEKRNPKLMNASRKKRVARGSGVEVQEINRLLKMHIQMAGMMKKMGKGKGGMLGKTDGHGRWSRRRHAVRRRNAEDAGRACPDGPGVDSTGTAGHGRRQDAPNAERSARIARPRRQGRHPWPAWPRRRRRRLQGPARLREEEIDDPQTINTNQKHKPDQTTRKAKRCAHFDPPKGKYQMALKIRLARGGSKKRPFYRIVVADMNAPRDGRFIEKLGTYNPLLPKDSADRVNIDMDRAKHWMSVGAKPTDRVLRFLDAAGVEKREARNNPNKAKPGKKRLEREAAEVEAAAKAKAATEAEAIAAKEAEEAAKKAAAEAAAAPAEEAPAEAPVEEGACRSSSPCRRNRVIRVCTDAQAFAHYPRRHHRRSRHPGRSEAEEFHF